MIAHSEQQAAANAQHVAEVRLVCAWCQKVLQNATPDAKTSHGICEDCAWKLEGRIA